MEDTVKFLTKLDSPDHVEYLGNTVTEIAEEKAGIMKQGVPVVFTDAEEAVTPVFLEKAHTLSSEVFPMSKSDYAFLKFKNKTIDFSYRSRYDEYVELRLRTMAGYQMENCTLAVRAIEVLDTRREISLDTIKKGFINVAGLAEWKRFCREYLWMEHTMKMVSEHFWIQFLRIRRLWKRYFYSV